MIFGDFELLTRRILHPKLGTTPFVKKINSKETTPNDFRGITTTETSFFFEKGHLPPSSSAPKNLYIRRT